jgi:hypothetical protein
MDVGIKAEVMELPDQRRMLKWELTSLTSDILAGFLPPNDCDNTKVPPEPPGCTHRGEGSVEFSVLPRKDVMDGDEIENEAEIFFDERAPIRTNRVVHRIDPFLLPEEPRLPQPEEGAGGGVALDSQLSWKADRADTFDLFLWRAEDPKPAEPTARGLQACWTSAIR